MTRSLKGAVFVILGLAAAAPAVQAQPPTSVPVRRAAPLDSAARAAKRAMMTELDNLRRTAPAAYDSIRSIYALVVHMQLGRLGYIAGPFDATLTPTLANAIREYERDRGLPVTGNPLTFELIASLEDDEASLAQQPSLPTRVITMHDGSVLLQGAWTFPDMGEQFTAVKIICYRQTMRCIESQAILDRESVADGSLSTDLQEWVVSRWDNVEIATLPVDFLCARYLLRINLVQRNATKIRSTISNDSLCSHAQREELIITLHDGPELAAKQVTERRGFPFPARLTPRASAILNFNRDRRD